MPIAPLPSSPLSARQYSTIQKGLAEIMEALELCDKLDTCGIDTSAQRADIETTRNTLEALKAQFYPEKP